jgi:hypothetical protein
MKQVTISGTDEETVTQYYDNFNREGGQILQRAVLLANRLGRALMAGGAGGALHIRTFSGRGYALSEASRKETGNVVLPRPSSGTRSSACGWMKT